jgi:hypothetical protein
MKLFGNIALVAVVLIIVMAALGIYSFGITRDSIREETRDELASVAGVMATRINASDLAGLSPGDENTPQYVALVQRLRTMRSMNDHIVNAYILRVRGDQVTSFLVDDLALDDPQGSAKIGEHYNSPDQRQIFAALSLPTASEEAYTDRWGTFMSGYAPIDDQPGSSNGNTSAVLGIDMAAHDYTDRVAAAGISIMTAMILSMVLVVGIMGVFSWRIRGMTGKK